MVDTHCLPTGSLGTSQIPVNQVGADTVTITDSTHVAVGGFTRRGIVVWLHPSQNSDMPFPLTVPNSIGETFTPLQSAVNADGWIFVYPAYPMDWSVNGVGYFGNVYYDVANDPNHAARFSNTILLWWDHMIQYLDATYGAGRPIIIGGFSLGAWAALTIAIGRTSTIVGYIAHCPATDWEVLFPSHTPGYNFALQNFSGMDLSTTALNNVSVPGIIGLSNTDSYVGWTTNTAQTTPMTWTGISITNVTITNGQPSLSATGFAGVVPGMVPIVTSGTGTIPSTTVASVGATSCILNASATGGGTATVTFGGPPSNSYSMIQSASVAGQPVTLYPAASSSVGTLPTPYPSGHLFYSGGTATYDALRYSGPTTVASCGTVNTSASVSVSNQVFGGFQGIPVGVTVSGTNIPTGASVVVNNSASVVTISSPATGTAGVETLTFSGWIPQVMDPLYGFTF